MPWLFRQPLSKYWWVGYRYNGRQFRFSTRTDDEEQAKKELAKVEAMFQLRAAGKLTETLFRQLSGSSFADVSLRDQVNAWLKECAGLSGSTLERYSTIIEELCEFLKADPQSPLLRDVQPDAIAAFLRQKRAETSINTAKLARRIVAAFFNHCVQNRLLTLSPVPSARSLKLVGRGSESEKRRAFTIEELNTIYSKAPDDFWRYMVLAGFYCGQRMGDLICLPWGAVDFPQNAVRLVTMKTGKSVWVPLRRELRLLLHQIWLRTRPENRRPADPIWPEQAAQYAKEGARNFSNAFYDDVLLPAGLVRARTHKAKVNGEERTRRRQVNPVSFHCLRHSFVTMLKATGGSQAVAKELAGHSSDAVSDLYTHMPAELLSKAIEQLPDVRKPKRKRKK